MNFIKKMLSENIAFFKVLSLNSLSMFFRILSGTIINKAVAVFVGPSGMALLGNFRNILSLIENIGLLGWNQGIVQNISENKASFKERKAFLSTIWIYLFVWNMIIIALLLVFKNQIIDFLIPQFSSNLIYYTFVFMVPFCTINLFLMSILNGFEYYEKFLKLSFLGQIITFICSLILIYFHHLKGAMIGLILVPIIMFVINFIWISRKIPFVLQFKPKLFSNNAIKFLWKFSFVMLFGAVLNPLTNWLIRNFIVQNEGLQFAGFWESINRVSGFYLVFVTTLCNLYFLPKFSKSINKQQIHSWVKLYFKYVFTGFTISMLILFMTKKIVIKTLLSPDFLPIEKMFFWQQLGDVFKVASVIFGYLILSKQKTNLFLFTEVTSYIIQIFLAYFFIQNFGTQGAIYAYCMSMFIYAILMIFVAKKSNLI